MYAMLNRMIDIIFILIFTFFASFVGTTTGFGTSTIMVPLLLLFLPAPQALLFAGSIHWFGNIWKVTLFKKSSNLKLVFLFGLPGLIISFFAALLPINLPESLLRQILGTFIIAYIAFLVAAPKWKLKASSKNAIIGGSLSGFFAGVFGVGGTIRSSFLAAYNLEKTVFIFTSGAIGFFIDSARITQYLLSGTVLNSLWAISLLCSIPVSLAGALIAKKVVLKIPQEQFRTIILLTLFCVGLVYLIFGQIYV